MSGHVRFTVRVFNEVLVIETDTPLADGEINIGIGSLPDDISMTNMPSELYELHMMLQPSIITEDRLIQYSTIMRDRVVIWSACPRAAMDRLEEILDKMAKLVTDRNKRSGYMVEIIRYDMLYSESGQLVNR